MSDKAISVNGSGYVSNENMKLAVEDTCRD